MTLASEPSVAPAAALTFAPPAAPAAFTVEADPRHPAYRLAAVFDPATMGLMDDGDGAGVVTAHGHVAGVPAFAFATDATRRGGALGARGCRRIVRAIGRAAVLGVPVIGLWHSGGADLREGVASLHGMGQVFRATVAASGKIPQISVVLGPSAGGAAYGPALTDIVIMGSGGRIFVTGPDIVKSVTGEDIDIDRLGGTETHARRSGVAHLTCPDDLTAIAAARTVTELLGRPGTMTSTVPDQHRDPADLLPTEPHRAYDVRPLVHALLDGPGMELQPRWAPSITTTLGRLAGRTVGVLANNPLRLGGCLNTVSAEKAARFVRMCDAFGVPLLVLVDVPGYLPGVDQEQDGVVRRGAKLLHAFAEAVTPRVTLITRKAYGGAYIAMNSRALGATAVFAWPDSQVAVMGPEAAVKLMHRRTLAATAPEDLDRVLADLVHEQRHAAGSIDRAVELGVVDAIIKPGETRQRIAEALAHADHTRGNHHNIPL